MRAAAITVSLILACAGVPATASSPALPPQGVLLTNAGQVRDAPATETAKALPVSLSGVVIDKADPNQQAVILQDGNTGIYVAPKNNAGLFESYRRGDFLEIHGVTDPGQFAPIVIADTVKKLGTAKIPAAQPVTYQQLITGSLDAQWVEISGVVRQCYTNQTDPNSDIQTIIVASDGGLVPVGLVKGPGQQIQVDSEVRVRAVSLYLFDQKRQAVTPVLHVPQGEPVVVEKAAPIDPFDTPLRSTASLLMFSPDNLYGYAHRVHVRGIVTCCQPGAFVWIRDGNMGLSIQTTQPESLQPGDKIDVLGFPTFGSYPPTLKDSTIRKIGYAQPLPPLALTNFNAAFDHENDLVAVDGNLTQIQPVLNGVALTLDKDGQLFKAFLKAPSAELTYPGWQVGSKVTVIGICSVAYDDTVPLPGIWQPKSFQIVLRSPSDLMVLARPPWWTLGHVAMLLGIVTCVLVLMMGLVMFSSRRRLQEQERQRQMAEAEFAAILSERNRMAREIHDTLAQGLAATSVQLRLAKKFLNGGSEAAAEHLDTAQQLVRDSLEESRDSIWNMRSHVLENHDLADALQQILRQMAGGTEIKTRFEVIGRSRRLAPVVENNILRIGQEAISNATKHSGAKDINVTLEFLEKQFRLKVADNGCGFDPNNPPFTDGGFGMIGMRERAAELNGQLNVRSSPGQGSDITLDAPLSKS
jgi:signal transduction histidine kinase